MAYVVLARKFRPQHLGEVIGQDAVVQTLRNAIKLKRIHHAYLFTGARGVGKTSIARILAKSLNCQNGPTDTPCGECAPCTEIAKSASPDVLEIDGASNTSVDDVRDLRETVKYLPSRGKYKIYIIDEVHMLSTSAFNALLKTLEEPPEHVIFVFATTEPHKIPITILSRCQRFDFRRVPTAILAERLQFVAGQEGVKLQAHAVQLIAKAADGSVRDSMSLLDQVIAFSGNDIGPAEVQRALGLLDREKVRALLNGILARDRLAVSKLVQEAFTSGADLAEIAERLVEVVRDLALAKMTNGQSETLSDLMPEDLQALLAAGQALSAPDLHRLFSTVAKTADDTARSPFPHLTFEMGLLRACDLEPVTALADLVNQLRGGEAPRAPGPGSSGGPAPSGAPTVGFTPPSPQPPRALSVVAPPMNDAPQAQDTSSPMTSGALAMAVAAPTLVPSEPPKAPAQHLSVAPTAAKAATEPAQPLPPPSDYRSFTARVIVLKPRIGAAFENVACESFSPERIVVRVPPGNEVFGDMLEEPETQTMLQDLFIKLFGVRTVLELTRGAAEGGAPATLADERRSERQDEVKKLRQHGADHPAVHTVLQMFGGSIRGVQVSQALSRPAEDYE